MSTLIEEIERKYKEGNHLTSALIEVTHRCCCTCRHCYLARDPSDELSLEEIEDLLDQIRGQGAIHVGFTGGEPLLRSDFPRILETASKLRFTSSILTTGIPVGPAEVKLFARNRVQEVSLSILGGNAETHDDIARFPGAFERMREAARLASAEGIRVKLKATILNPSRHQVADMKAVADSVGAEFAANPSVLIRTDGDRSPQDLALDEEALAEVDPAQWNGSFSPDEESWVGAVLSCKAGRNIVGISPQGDVYPCLVLRHVLGNVRTRSLQSILHDAPQPFLTWLRGLGEEDAAECFACEERKFCRRCPGAAFMESQDVRSKAPGLCIQARGLARAHSVDIHAQ